MKTILSAACTILGVLVLPGTSSAESAKQGPVFTVLEENDLVFKTDRHYTQGIKVSYFHTDGWLPFGSGKLFEALPELGFQKDAGKFGYSIGQNIYTPADTASPLLQTKDRPYGGWLYAGAILQRRGTSWGGRPALEDFEAEFGFIGPAALARESQSWVHHVRGIVEPRGWSHQLENEPGLRLKYSRSVSFRWMDQSNLLSLDFTPHAGLSLGNVETSGRIGGTLRLGIPVPEDFGIHFIDSLATTSGGITSDKHRRWGAYLFARAEGRAVAHNAFLDGNLFASSHRVDKEYLVGDFSVGFVVLLNRVELGYALFARTAEFRRQAEHDAFGAVFLKIKCNPR